MSSLRRKRYTIKTTKEFFDVIISTKADVIDASKNIAPTSQPIKTSKVEVIKASKIDTKLTEVIKTTNLQKTEPIKASKLISMLFSTLCRHPTRRNPTEHRKCINPTFRRNLIPSKRRKSGLQYLEIPHIIKTSKTGKPSNLQMSSKRRKLTPISSKRRK